MDFHRILKPSFIDRCGRINWAYRKQLKILIDFIEEKEYNILNKNHNVIHVDACLDWNTQTIQLEAIVNEGRKIQMDWPVEVIVQQYKDSLCCS